MSDLERLLTVRGGGRARDFIIRRRLYAPDRLRGYWFRGTSNFGDQMAPAILQWVCGNRPIWVSRDFRGKILSIGSVLAAVAPGDTIWGSGAIEDRMYDIPAGTRITAVRGPLTRARMRADVPEVFGDPASLLPLFHNPSVDQRFAVGVVPHYKEAPMVKVDDPAVRVIDVRQSWTDVVAQILSCEVIVSSSLHGLIVAEAYGIPASWVWISDQVLGGGFKFNDYFLATGRNERSPTLWGAGLGEAVENTCPPSVFDQGPLLEAAGLIQCQHER